MTSDERETSRINKSTLLRIKKNSSDGKTPKTYQRILLKLNKKLQKNTVIFVQYKAIPR